MSVTRIGVWAGHGLLGQDRGRYLQVIRDVGFTDVCLVANDNTKRKDWHLYPGDLPRACNDIRAAGAMPHLMSWAVGSEAHTIEAVNALPDLAKACAVESVMLDAEEPWITPRVDHTALSGHYADLSEQLHALDIQLGVTAIVFTTWKAVEPLTMVADYVVPQAYSSADKPTVMQLGHAAYRTRGPGRMDTGLKGYNQTVASLPAGRKATEALADPVVNRVWYWSLYQISQSKQVQAFLRAWCKEVRHA